MRGDVISDVCLCVCMCVYVHACAAWLQKDKMGKNGHWFTMKTDDELPPLNWAAFRTNRAASHQEMTWRVKDRLTGQQPCSSQLHLKRRAVTYCQSRVFQSYQVIRKCRHQSSHRCHPRDVQPSSLFVTAYQQFGQENEKPYKLTWLESFIEKTQRSCGFGLVFRQLLEALRLDPRPWIHWIQQLELTASLQQHNFSHYISYKRWVNKYILWFALNYQNRSESFCAKLACPLPAAGLRHLAIKTLRSQALRQLIVHNICKIRGSKSTTWCKNVALLI